MLFRSAPCIGAPFLRRADHGGDCTQLPVQEFKQMQTVRIVGRASAPRARLGACQFVITGAQQSADQPLESLELSLAPDSRCNPACLVAQAIERLGAVAPYEVIQAALDLLTAERAPNPALALPRRRTVVEERPCRGDRKSVVAGKSVSVQ